MTRLIDRDFSDYVQPHLIVEDELQIIYSFHKISYSKFLFRTQLSDLIDVHFEKILSSRDDEAQEIESNERNFDE